MQEDEKDAPRRLAKLKAQQLKEMQQKEAEQLRELQHLKAKFALGQYDMELEFTEVYERQKAEQLVSLNVLDRCASLDKLNFSVGRL